MRVAAVIVLSIVGPLGGLAAGVDTIVVERRAVSIIRYNENALVMIADDHKQTSGLHSFFFPKRILGSLKYEAEGLRFVPFRSAPGGVSPEIFSEKYENKRLDPQEVFISYASIKKVRNWYGVKVKLQDGTMHTFLISPPRQTIRKIESHLKLK